MESVHKNILNAVQAHTKSTKENVFMEDLVLTIPTQDLGIIEAQANRMGWTVQSKRNIVQNFLAIPCQNSILLKKMIFLQLL